jgi:hypothetical protein
LDPASLPILNCLWFPEIRIWLIHWKLSLIHFVTPASTLMAVLAAARDCLRTRATLQIEVLALRHQLNVLQRSVKRPRLTAADRFLWARLSRLWTGWRSALVIVKPETVIQNFIVLCVPHHSHSGERAFAVPLGILQIAKISSSPAARFGRRTMA